MKRKHGNKILTCYDVKQIFSKIFALAKANNFDDYCRAAFATMIYITRKSPNDVLKMTLKDAAEIWRLKILNNRSNKTINTMKYAFYSYFKFVEFDFLLHAHKEPDKHFMLFEGLDLEATNMWFRGIANKTGYAGVVLNDLARANY